MQAACTPEEGQCAATEFMPLQQTYANAAQKAVTTARVQPAGHAMADPHQKKHKPRCCQTSLFSIFVNWSQTKPTPHTYVKLSMTHCLLTPRLQGSTTHMPAILCFMPKLPALQCNWPNIARQLQRHFPHISQPGPSLSILAALASCGMSLCSCARGQMGVFG